jgi:transposase
MPKQETQAKPTRRRYAADFKRELVERSLQPGASVSRIALESGINANVLFKWRRERLRADSPVHVDGVEQAVLLPVEVATTGAMMEAPRVKREAVSSPPAMPTGVIEIDIGGARVRLRGSVDETNVRCVLQALKALA